jgi:hypothetical protein
MQISMVGTGSNLPVYRPCQEAWTRMFSLRTVPDCLYAHQYLDYKYFVDNAPLSTPVFRIEICINLSCWILIRIQVYKLHINTGTEEFF